MFTISPLSIGTLANTCVNALHFADILIPKHNPVFKLFSPTSTDSRKQKLKHLDQKVKEVATKMGYPNPRQLSIRMEKNNSSCVAHGTNKRGVIGFSPGLIDEIPENNYLPRHPLFQKFTDFIQNSPGDLNTRRISFNQKFTSKEVNEIRSNLAKFSYHLSGDEINFIIAHEISHLMEEDTVTKTYLSFIGSAISLGISEYLYRRSPESTAWGYLMHLSFFLIGRMAVEVVQNASLEKRADAKASTHYANGGKMLFKRMELLKVIQSQSTLTVFETIKSMFFSIKERVLYGTHATRMANCIHAVKSHSSSNLV